MSIWMFFCLHFGTIDKTLGPHRANMLEAIDRFGSISAAAPAVNLMFRQSWELVQELNNLFDQPLIGIRRSGRNSGAYLTPLGKEVLGRVREIQRVFDEALKPHLHDLAKSVGLDPNAPPPIPREARIVDPATIPIAKKQKRSPQAPTKQKRKPAKTSRKRKPAKKASTRLSHHTRRR